MFLRIRGKGACPENSQAALLHLRGFRHVQCPPPQNIFEAAALLPQGPSSKAGTSEEQQVVVQLESKPMTFAHFAVGIQAPSVVADQLSHEAAGGAKDNGSVTAAPDTTTTTTTTAAAAGTAEAVNPLLPMAWKELWNVYDICYDEVPLLPQDFGTTNEQLKKLAEVAETGGAGPALPADFTRPSTRTGNSKAIVCTHYCSQQAWPQDAFNRKNNPAENVRSASADTVVVVDLTDLPPATCGSRLALSLAWSLGFASLQPDNVLLRTAALIVRLPYTFLPPSTRTQAKAPAEDYRTALEEATGFLAQHAQLVLDACHTALHQQASAKVDKDSGAAAVATLSDCCAYRPPIAFIGASATELQKALKAFTTGPHAAVRQVAVLRTDEYRSAAPAGEGSTSSGVADDEETVRVAAAAAAGCGVVLLVAPVRALIDGGEEPWDAYTLKERSRLNYCPCCGSCGITEGQEGSDEGAGHGHAHGHGHSH